LIDNGLLKLSWLSAHRVERPSGRRDVCWVIIQLPPATQNSSLHEVFYWLIWIGHRLYLISSGRCSSLYYI